MGNAPGSRRLTDLEAGQLARDGVKETGGRRPVDRPVVEGQTQTDLSGHDGANSKNSGLGRIEHRGELFNAEHPEVGDGEGCLGTMAGAARTGIGDSGVDGRGDLGDRLARAVLGHGNTQLAIDVNGDPQVDTVSQIETVVDPESIQLWMFRQRVGAGCKHCMCQGRTHTLSARNGNGDPRLIDAGTAVQRDRRHSGSCHQASGGNAADARELELAQSTDARQVGCRSGSDRDGLGAGLGVGLGVGVGLRHRRRRGANRHGRGRRTAPCVSNSTHITSDNKAPWPATGKPSDTNPELESDPAR